MQEGRLRTSRPFLAVLMYYRHHHIAVVHTSQLTTPVYAQPVYSLRTSVCATHICLANAACDISYPACICQSRHGFTEDVAVSSE